MKILYVVCDTEAEWNSSRWRCMIPAAAMRKAGHSVGMMKPGEFVASYNEGAEEGRFVGQYDIIIFQRNMCEPELFRAATYWSGAGKPVIVDLDDYYAGLPPTNRAWEFWHNAEQSTHLRQMMTYLPLLDGVSSPSKKILEDWQELGVKHAYWMPNYADGSHFINLSKEPHDGFVIGWGGSHSHYDTWVRSACKEGIRLAFEARPDMRAMVYGADTRVFEMLPIPNERKAYAGLIAPNEIQKWPQALAQFDVALAPLGGQYDQRRSWIHALEPMLCNVPWIGSSGFPFADVASYGHVVLQETPEAWAEMLIDAHDNYVEWTALAERAYAQALGYTMERNIGQYAQTIAKIIQRRRAAMGGRLPGVTTV